jgi:hypothetical protein
MSTTASSIRNIKSRLPTSNSIHNMTNNGNENKSNGIYRKKPLSATNMLQNYSSINALNNHLKKRSFHHSNKLTKSASIDGKIEKKINGHHSHTRLSNNSSPPIIFHVIAPAPMSEELNDSRKQTNEEQKV